MDLKLSPGNGKDKGTALAFLIPKCWWHHLLQDGLFHDCFGNQQWWTQYKSRAMGTLIFRSEAMGLMGEDPLLPQPSLLRHLKTSTAGKKLCHFSLLCFDPTSATTACTALISIPSLSSSTALIFLCNPCHTCVFPILVFLVFDFFFRFSSEICPQPSFPSPLWYYNITSLRWLWCDMDNVRFNI